MQNAPKWLAPMLLLLAMNLTGCSTPSKPQPVPTLPQPPAELLEPQPSTQTYSDRVRALLLDWRQRLTNGAKS